MCASRCRCGSPMSPPISRPIPTKSWTRRQRLIFARRSSRERSCGATSAYLLVDHADACALGSIKGASKGASIFHWIRSGGQGRRLEAGPVTTTLCPSISRGCLVLPRLAAFRRAFAIPIKPVLGFGGGAGWGGGWPSCAMRRMASSAIAEAS